MAPKRAAQPGPSPPSKRTRTSTSTSTSTPPKKPKTKTRAKAKSKPSIRSQRSIWNSKDDWDTLVSESNLSTSSISTRPPRLRELPSLVRCATVAISRGFKRLWDTGDEESGKEFKIAWNYLPNHLKELIRENVFRWWGGFLTVKIISEVFLIPPHLYLPGELLPSISSTEYLKTLIPPRSLRDSFTSLTLKHASKASDLGVSALVYNLPNLDTINLKGCSLVGEKTISAILKRITNLKKINLKGTKITEEAVKSLVDKYGDQLECFKVDDIHFENINDTFSSTPFRKIRKLCLPGNLLNASSKDFRNRAKVLGHSIGYPAPRQTPQESIIQWSNLNVHFPNLTHLYLPNLLIPDETIINLNPGLVKLVLGPGGPPVPVDSLIPLIENQVTTLKSIHLGHLKPNSWTSSFKITSSFEKLGEILNDCTELEEFKLQVGPMSSVDSLCHTSMSRYSDLVYGPGLCDNWRKSLKIFSLSVPQTIKAALFLDPDYPDPQRSISPLERIELPSANVDDTHVLAAGLSSFKRLRSLDLSGSMITDREMRVILYACPLLSRIDLTSCRGINVRHRRNIFQISFTADQELEE